MASTQSASQNTPDEHNSIDRTSPDIDRPKSFAEITTSPEAIDVSERGNRGVMKIPLWRPKTPTEKPDLPAASCCFVVHYEAFLEGSKEPFDSTRTRGRPACWCLRQVLPGLAVACLNLDIGEKAQFVLSPDYFLGSVGCPPRIPGNSSALYEIELLRIRPADTLQEGASAEELKAHGNHLFADKRNKEAIKMWQKALSLCEEGAAKNADMDDLKEVLHLNIACAALAMQNWERAKRHCSRALEINRMSVKGLYRMAVASRHLGDFDSAKRCLESLLRLQPQSLSARTELKILDEQLAGRHQDNEQAISSKEVSAEVRGALERKLDEFQSMSQNKVFTLDADMFDEPTLRFLTERAQSKGLKTRLISYEGVKVLHVLK